MLPGFSDTVESLVAEWKRAGCAVELVGILEGKTRCITVFKVTGDPLTAPVHMSVAEDVEPDPMDFPRPMGVAPYHGPHLRDLPQPLGASLRRAP